MMDITSKVLALIDVFFLIFALTLAFSSLIGFTVYEAGLIRAKNTSSLIVNKLSVIALSALLFVSFSYQLMFATDNDGAAIFPFMNKTWVWDVWVHSPAAGKPVAKFYSNFIFQWLFAALNVLIVAGAIAERVRLFSFLFFTVVMTGFIYPVIGHWVWNTGFLYRAGFSDFAGAGVVHLSAAAASLAGILLVGSRMGKYTTTQKSLPIRGANLPLASLGVLFIWLGFLGLNAGAELAFSQLKNADNVATIVASTLMAGSGGILGALFFSRIFLGKVDLTFVLNGLLSSLVAVSASPVMIHIDMAILLGVVAAGIALILILILDYLRIDDPVGVIAVHGGGAIVGLLALPWLESEASFLAQLLGIGAIFGFSFLASLLSWWLIKVGVGLRVSEAEEIAGLDVTDCGLEAYPEFIKTR